MGNTSFIDESQLSSTHTHSSHQTPPRTRRYPSSRHHRVSRACERCRIRKVKCDGGRPCIRCTEVDDICDYPGRQKRDLKMYTQRYVDNLLGQNARVKAAMRVLYANRRLSIAPDMMAVPQTHDGSMPSVHEILDVLGLASTRDEEILSSLSIDKAATGNEKILDSRSSASQSSSSYYPSNEDTDSCCSFAIPETIHDTPSFEPMYSACSSSAHQNSHDFQFCEAGQLDGPLDNSPLLNRSEVCDATANINSMKPLDDMADLSTDFSLHSTWSFPLDGEFNNILFDTNVFQQCATQPLEVLPAPFGFSSSVNRVEDYAWPVSPTWTLDLHSRIQC